MSKNLFLAMNAMDVDTEAKHGKRIGSGGRALSITDVHIAWKMYVCVCLEGVQSYVDAIIS